MATTSLNRDSAGRYGANYTKWQASCIVEKKKRRSEDEKAEIRKRQQELQSAIQEGHQKLGIFLRKQIGMDCETEIHRPVFPRPRLTSDELPNPPYELEVELGSAWKDIPPRFASRPLDWFLWHIAWIEEGRFGESGHHLAALAGGSTIEATTRAFLRRTGGLFGVRGNVSVFSDCPLARAWWRFHLSVRVEKALGGRLSRQDVHRLFRERGGQAWEELVTCSLRRVTVVNQPRARAILVERLHSRLQSNGGITREEVREISSDLARKGLRRSFDQTPLEELLA